MSEIDRLVDQFERAMCGDAWHGNPVVAILQRIRFPAADAKAARGAEPKEGDWPKASGKTAAAWAAEIDALIGAHNALI